MHTFNFKTKENNRIAAAKFLSAKQALCTTNNMLDQWSHTEAAVQKVLRLGIDIPSMITILENHFYDHTPHLCGSQYGCDLECLEAMKGIQKHLITH